MINEYLLFVISILLLTVVVLALKTINIKKYTKPSISNKYRPYDMHTFTNRDIAVILEGYARYKLNRGTKAGFTQLELTSLLNSTLGLNKSISAYRRIWSIKHNDS